MLTVLKKRSFRGTLAGVLVACLAMGAVPTAAFALGTPDIQSAVMNPLIDETKTSLADGITERKMTFTNAAGDRTQAFSVDVDLSNPNNTIMTGTPDDGTSYGMQTVRDQANAAIQHGKQVVAAVNGDYYNMATGEPVGMELKDGVEIKNASGWNFFGIKKNGTPVIGTSALYDTIKGDLQQAIGGPKILVANGQVATTAEDLYPSQAVGIRADNSVFFVTVDGRQAPYSNGVLLKNLAQLLVDMGAVQGMELDGGGSATYVSQTPGDDALSVKNRPSDGMERTVGNSLLIVTKATRDHQFVRANVTPEDKTYSPNSTVVFSAAGVDASGSSAPLPTSGLSWSLSDPSFGTMDSDTGTFTSTGKIGQVTAQLSDNGTVVGSTIVEIAVPDDLHFMQSSLSLKFSVDQDMGLIARYQGRDVILHAGDIQWNFDPALGVMGSNNILRTASLSASGPMTATLAGTSLSASISVQVGQLPVVLYDFENGLGDWSASTAGRGEVTSVAVSSYPSEPARFGEHSLKLNFDLTHAQTGTTLGAYAGPATSKAIPGMPSAMGMWIYGTPESRGYWARMYIYDKSGGVKPIDLTSQATGIDWLGWKYVEAPIPSTYQGPFKTVSKQMVRLLSLKSGMTGGGPMTSGTVYVDNVRAVYGASVDDLNPPIVDSVSVDGKTYTRSAVNISASIREDTSAPNSTGLNWGRAKILVDGKDYSTASDHFSYDMDGTLNLSGISWPDGVHKVTIDIQDNYSNETTKDVYFTVNSGSGTRVEVAKGGDSAPLGSTYPIVVTTNNMADVAAVSATVHLAKGFPVTGVTFGADASASGYTYDPATGTLVLNIVNTSTASAGTLATVNVAIPSSTTQGSALSYSVSSSAITYAQDRGDGFGASFSLLPVSVPVTAGYTIAVKSSIVGQDGVVVVTDSNGSPAQGVLVTMTPDGGAAQQLSGVTDSNGQLSSGLLTQSTAKFTLTASKDGLFSFPVQAQAYNPVLTAAPANRLAGSTQDPTTEKTITWMTNPLQGENAAIMQIAPQDAYAANGVSAFQNYTGTRTVITYSADSSAIMLSSVTATGLAPGRSYSFRVGDGTTWSDVRSFTTLTTTNTFSFNVFGDTQVTQPSGLDDFSSMITAIENDPVQSLFSIHIGDFTDDQTVFGEMDMTAAMLNEHPTFDSRDMIHVLGNHEYAGDNGTKSASILGLPNNNGPAADTVGNYSVTYGNMHIAVLDWTDNAGTMAKEMDWLRADMANSTATWKVVAAHQPSYNKNPADAGSTMFGTMLTPVMDELGIDLVFNGHDHSYGRTYPLVANKPSAGGTTYLATGHSGDKIYDILPNDPSVYAAVQTDKNDKVYLTLAVTGNTLHLKATRPDGSIMDEADITAHSADRADLAAAISANITRSNGSYTYTTSSWAAFQAALAAAQSAQGNAAATQAEVDAATKALVDAATALETNVADKGSLAAILANAPTDPPSYTPASWATYSQAKTAARAVFDRGSATQDEVDRAYNEFAGARDALAFAADKELLRQAIDIADNTDTSVYKPSLVQKLTDALSSAHTVLADPNASQADVDAAVSDVTGALNNLQVIVDNHRLTDLIASAQALTQAKYTATSWSAMRTALDAATTVAANKDASADDVTAAYNALANTVSGLTLRANMASLSAAIGIAQRIVDGISDYAPATVSGLSGSLSEAKAVLGQDDATQAQVDAAASTLLTKIASARIKADKKVLGALVGTAASVNIAQFSPETVAVYTAALSRAQALLVDDNAAQADVDAVVRELGAAKTALVPTSSGNGAGTPATTPVVASSGVPAKGTDNGGPGSQTGADAPNAGSSSGVSPSNETSSPSPSVQPSTTASPSATPTPVVAADPAATVAESGPNLGLVLGIVAGILLLLLAGVGAVIRVRRKM